MNHHGDRCPRAMAGEVPIPLVEGNFFLLCLTKTLKFVYLFHMQRHRKTFWKNVILGFHEHGNVFLAELSLLLYFEGLTNTCYPEIAQKRTIWNERYVDRWPSVSMSKKQFSECQGIGKKTRDLKGKSMNSRPLNFFFQIFALMKEIEGKRLQ